MLMKLRRKDDPIVRNVEKGHEDEGLSPMAPPAPYAPPGKGTSIAYEAMHPFLRELRDEHRTLTPEIDAFEAALGRIKTRGIERDTDPALARFFRCLDETLFPHNRWEERWLFPLLAERLVEVGECNKSPPHRTAVDLLVDEHDEFLQLAALVFNFFALAGRLRDAEARATVLNTAVQQAEALIEALKLHIFREDEIVFSLAHQHLTAAELDQLVARSAPFREPEPGHEHDHEHAHEHDHDHDHA